MNPVGALAGLLLTFMVCPHSFGELIRGPYLQSAGPNSIVVRWRTSGPEDSRVYYGLTPSSTDQLSYESGHRTEHVIYIGDLSENTRYYYTVGNSTAILAEGEDQYFVTSPNTAKPTRIWVLGDSGTASQGSDAPQEVRDSFYWRYNNQPPDVWLMLGDNAYEEGTDAQYQTAVFQTFSRTLRNTPLWSALGNHEGHSIDPNGEFPYFNIFTLPMYGEAGGVPSGSENYYSFDYGNIHFICLDSFISSRAPDSPMAQWVMADLEQTEKDWIIAFFHHPPYSKGTHDSDIERELIEMRQNLLPILEAYGVDLVLAGHSHVYERSYLLNGHYGISSTFSFPHHVLNAGTGMEFDDGPYYKPAGGLGANKGTVYVVAGSSGQRGGGSLNHPAMIYSSSELGSLVIDVNGLRLDLIFLRDFPAVDDRFTLIKGQAIDGTRPSLTLEPTGPLITWPTSVPEFDLQQSDHPDRGWEAVPNPISTIGRKKIFPINLAGFKKFFRLQNRDDD